MAELSQPLAVLHGAHEAVLMKREWFDTLRMPTLWRGAVQQLPDAGHSPHWETPEAFNRLLEQFASDCTKR